MDFDKCLLQNELARHTRNQDWLQAGRSLMRYSMSFGDNVCYAPQGLAAYVRKYLPISKRTSFRVLEQLHDHGYCHKIDEYSLQMDPGLSMKGNNPIKYGGEKLILTAEELAMGRELALDRDAHWAKRGKNKKHTSKDTDNMNLLIQTLTKQLDTKDQQIEQLLLLINKVSGGEVSPMEIKRHLTLIKNGE